MYYTHLKTADECLEELHKLDKMYDKYNARKTLMGQFMVGAILQKTEYLSQRYMELTGTDIITAV